MPDLLQVYPRLERWISQICANRSWGITGVSALVGDGDAWLFEVTKPKHWYQQPDGTRVAGMGAIGGSLERGESALACLRREVMEELDARVWLESVPRTHVVFEQEPVGWRALAEFPHPRPMLFTVSRNLYRLAELPHQEILAIATFRAELATPWSLGDLYGVLRVPQARLADVLLSQGLHVRDLGMFGVGLVARESLAPDLKLEPTWTVRSIQRLVKAGWVDGQVW